MGFYKTAPESECHAKTHPPSKNRVWDFSTSAPICTRQSASQVPAPHREKRPTPTITVSGVRYYGYRYLHPELGRWISRDPIGAQGGLNVYGFVGNKPVLKYDWLGLKSCDCCENDLVAAGEKDNRIGQLMKVLMGKHQGVSKSMPNGDPSRPMCLSGLGCQMCSPADVGYGAGGFYNYNTGAIIICCGTSSNNSGSPDPGGALYHELQHAAEACYKPKITDCQGKVCAEVRARFCSGMPEDEARKDAKNSASGSKVCEGVSGETMDSYASACTLDRNDCYIPHPSFPEIP